LNDSKKNTLWLKCLSIQGNNIFIGTNEGILIRFNKTTGRTEIQKKISDEITGSSPIDDMFIDTQNRVWLFLSGHGILVTDTSFNKIKFIASSELSKNKIINPQFKGHALYDGNLFLATTEGLKIISVKDTRVLESTILPLSLPAEILEHELSAISEKEGRILLSGAHGLFELDIKKNELCKILPSKNYEDRNWFIMNDCLYQTDQSIWAGGAGNEGAGIAWIKNINSPFNAFCTSMNNNGIKLINCFTLCKRDDSTLITCADDGLYKINHITGGINKYRTPGSYLLAFTDSYNNLLVCGNNGLKIFDKNNDQIDLATAYPELLPLKNDTLLTCQHLGDSLFFLAGLSQKGMYIWNSKRKTLEIKSTNSTTSPLKSNLVKCLYLDSRNHLWIISDNSLSVYDPLNNTITHLNISLPGSINMDICELSNRFWIASYGTGIIELDNNYEIKNIYTEKEGISNSGVFKILPVNDSSLIVSSMHGLSVLNIYTKKIKTYFDEDGLQSDDFDMLSGYKNDRYIFMGGVGVTKIDISKLKENLYPPSFYFLNTKIEKEKDNQITDTRNLEIQKITVPNNWLQLNVSFIGINYLNPNRVTYKYKIKEVADNWIDLGTQNFINLIGLSPGKYTLEVKAANEDGVWCEPKTLVLTFEPKWYQTWWFDLLVALTTASLIYGFYRYRLMQIRKQHQIRKEIAGDLHDDIGATLNSVKIFTHLAEKSKDNKKYFANIKEALTYASVGLRDMIWVLDDSGDTITDLVKRLKMFAQPVTEASDISISFTEDPSANNITLNKTEKRNLLLIAKEAINNSIKYAECENIKVTFFKFKNKTSLTIEDDGKGFAEEKITRGNGLNNMQQRAKQIHYRITLESQEGNGTKITVAKK
jgi:hypothetical protein